MIQYLKKSFKKFIDDALSKMTYDVTKWAIVGVGALLVTLYWRRIKLWLFYDLQTPVYILIATSHVLISATALLTSILYKRKYSAIKTDYHTDALTELPNYLALNEYLPTFLTDLRKKQSSCSFILLYIDDFKRINEEAGYNNADLLLKKLAALLANDRRFTDEIYRFYLRGDEFLLILKETSLDGAVKAANRKRQLISRSIFEIHGVDYKLTVCCGVTEYQKEDDQLSLTNRLDRALKEAKKAPSKNSTGILI